MLNMVNEQELQAGFIEFLDGGLDEEAKGRYKLAVTAYFKAITQIADILIIRKRGFPPSNHYERFRVLEKEFPGVYKSVDGIFKTYQDTYSMPMSKESCETIKNEIREIITNGGLGKEFSEALSKLQGQSD